MVGAVDDFRISLQVVGDDVDPDQVSMLLGSQPTSAHRKGDAINGQDGTFRRDAKSGRWSLELSSRDLDDLDFERALASLVGSLTDDLSVWLDLSGKYDTGLFCGIFLADSNRGISLPAELMSDLAARDLYLGLDIYGPELPQRD